MTQSNVNSDEYSNQQSKVTAKSIINRLNFHDYVQDKDHL